MQNIIDCKLNFEQHDANLSKKLNYVLISIQSGEN